MTSFWRYGSTGYILLGAAVRRAPGATLAELLEREVPAPGGLQATTWNAHGRR